MNKILISKDRITFRSWNSERRGCHTVKKLNGIWSVINNESKEVVFTSFKKEDAEEFFIDEQTPPKNIISRLREDVEIVGDVSTLEIFNLIKENQQLYELSSWLLPGIDIYEDAFLKTRDARSNHEQPITLYRSGLVSDGILKIQYESTQTLCVHPNTPIVISKNLEIKDGDKIVSSNCETYSFLDLLYHIFGEHSENVFVLTPRGLVDEEGYDVFSPNRILLNKCILSHDLHLKDLIDFVESNEDLKNFIACYSWCRAIDEFHAQAKESCENTTTEVARLEIYRSGEVCRWTDDNKCKQISLDMNYDFHGIGPCSADSIEHYQTMNLEPPQEEMYSVSYTPLNEIIHLPLHLNTKMEVHEWVSSKQKNVLHFQCVYPMTLLEIIDAVYWDISFHGGPEDNKAFIDEMKGCMEKVKDGTEKMHGPFSSTTEIIQNIIDTTDDDLNKENLRELLELRFYTPQEKRKEDDKSE
jgi:hypothetical protein